MILSRNSFADLKTGMASPTIALVAAMASIGGRESLGSKVYRLGAVQAVVGTGVNRVNSLRGDSGSVDVAVYLVLRRGVGNLVR